MSKTGWIWTSAPRFYAAFFGAPTFFGAALGEEEIERAYAA